MFLGFDLITYLTSREGKIRATKDYKENLAEKLLCKPLGSVTFVAAQWKQQKCCAGFGAERSAQTYSFYTNKVKGLIWNSAS